MSGGLFGHFGYADVFPPRHNPSKFDSALGLTKTVLSKLPRKPTAPASHLTHSGKLFPFYKYCSVI